MRNLYKPSKSKSIMNKLGQLGFIEFKYFLGGLFAGILSGLVLVYLGSAKIIPFQIPAVCGFVKSKKGQLAGIEFHYALVGFAIGVIASFVLVYLGNSGILPFKFPVCVTATINK